MMVKTVVFTVGLSLAALAGCASNNVSCLHDHKIVSAKTDSAAVHIAYVEVRHEGDTLLVSGVLKRRDLSSQSIATHVDIAVLDEKGTVLKQVSTEEVYIAGKQVGKGPQGARFKVTVPLEVQQNLTVHAVPHSGPACAVQKS